MQRKKNNAVIFESVCKQKDSGLGLGLVLGSDLGLGSDFRVSFRFGLPGNLHWVV